MVNFLNISKKNKMITYKSKDLEIGLKIELNNEPYIIIDLSFSNIGRGQAFHKLKLKNLINNSIITKTIKVSERLKMADVLTKEIKYLYNTDNIFYFYEETTNDYYEINKEKIDNQIKWLKEGLQCIALLWNNEIIDIKLPKFIELKVIETDDIKKDLGTHKNYKNATTETNSTLKVPIFIKENDIIKIDTEENIYVSRIN